MELLYFSVLAVILLPGFLVAIYVVRSKIFVPLSQDRLYLFTCRISKRTNEGDSQTRMGIAVKEQTYSAAESRAHSALASHLQQHAEYAQWKEDKWAKGRIIDRKAASTEGTVVLNLFDEARRSANGVVVRSLSRS